MHKGVDAVKVFGGQEGKDPHTYFGPSIKWGLSRQRKSTKIGAKLLR